MRRLAIVVGSGAALAVLVYVGASLFLAAMRIDYSESLAVQLTKITGREVRLGNVSRLAGVLRPRIEIENLVMLAESEGNEEIARIERTVIGLDLVPLLRGVVHVDNIELYGVRLAISTDAAGELEWKPSFEATFTSESGEGMGVEIDDLDLSDVEIVYRDGVTGETTRSRLDSLRLDLEEGGRRAELVASGAVDGVEFELEGRLERITDDTLQGYVGEFEGRLEQGRIEAAGTVISPLELRGVDFRFTARLTEPLLVGGVELPPAVATGWLRDREGQLGLEDLEIEIARESNRLSVSGDVSDLIGDPKLQLELRVELQDASFLTQLIDLELPELGPIDGSALLASADGAFHLADVEVEVGAEGGPRLSAQGTVSDLTGLRDVELDVSVSAEDVRDFAPELLAERFSLGPVRGSARLTGAGDVFHLESIDLEAGAHDALWTRVTGRIDMVPGDLHLDLVARLESTRSSELERILEVDLPDLEPLRALIGIRGGSLGVDAELIEVHLGEGGDVLVNVTGEVLDLTDAARARVHFELSAPVLSAVGALFDQDLPAVGPVRASARLSTGRNRWALRGLKVEIGETIVSGSAALSNAADGRPRLSIELEAPRIHLASTPPPLLQERHLHPRSAGGGRRFLSLR